MQYKRRYYKDNKLSNYFEKILNEIEIMGILNKSDENEYIINLYELIYDNEGENKFSNLYVVTDYCSIGTIMNRDSINFNHYHNPNLIKYFYPDIKIEHENLEDISGKTEITEENILGSKHFQSLISQAENILSKLLLLLKEPSLLVGRFLF